MRHFGGRLVEGDFYKHGEIAVLVAVDARPIEVVSIDCDARIVAVVCDGGNYCAVHPLPCCAFGDAEVVCACGEAYIRKIYAVCQAALCNGCADVGRCGIYGNFNFRLILARFGVVSVHTRPIVVVVIDRDCNGYAVLALFNGGSLFGILPLPITVKPYVAHGIAVGYVAVDLRKLRHFGGRLVEGDFYKHGEIAVLVAVDARPIEVVSIDCDARIVAVVCDGGNYCAVHPLPCCAFGDAEVVCACGEAYIRKIYAVCQAALCNGCADVGRCGIYGNFNFRLILARFGVVSVHIRPIVVVVIDGNCYGYAVFALFNGGSLFGILPLPIIGELYVADGVAVGYVAVDFGSCGYGGRSLANREVGAYAALVVAVRRGGEGYRRRAGVDVIGIAYHVVVGGYRYIAVGYGKRCPLLAFVVGIFARNFKRCLGNVALRYGKRCSLLRNGLVVAVAGKYSCDCVCSCIHLAVVLILDFHTIGQFARNIDKVLFAVVFKFVAFKGYAAHIVAGFADIDRHRHGVGMIYAVITFYANPIVVFVVDSYCHLIAAVDYRGNG